MTNQNLNAAFDDAKAEAFAERFVGPPRRRSQRIGHSVRRWITKAKESWRMRREMAELSQLSAHLLKDMGLELCATPRDPAHLAIGHQED